MKSPFVPSNRADPFSRIERTLVAVLFCVFCRRDLRGRPTRARVRIVEEATPRPGPACSGRRPRLVGALCLAFATLASPAHSQQAPAPGVPGSEWDDGASAQAGVAAGPAEAAYGQWRSWQDEFVDASRPVEVPAEPWSALEEAAVQGHADAKLEFALLLTGAGDHFRIPEVDHARSARLLFELTGAGGRQAAMARLALDALGESGEPAQRRAVAEVRRERTPGTLPSAGSTKGAEAAPNWEDRRRDIDAAEGAERIRLCAEALREFPRRRDEIEELVGLIAAELDRVLRRELPGFSVDEAIALERAVDRLRKAGIGPISGEMVDRLERGRNLLALVKGPELPESLEDLAAVEAEMARIDSVGEGSFPELRRSALDRLGARREELREMEVDEDLANVGIERLLARAVALSQRRPERREEIASQVVARWEEIEEWLDETLASTRADPEQKERALESLGGMIEQLRESGLDELADRAETTRTEAGELWRLGRGESAPESVEAAEKLRRKAKGRVDRFPRLAMVIVDAMRPVASEDPMAAAESGSDSIREDDEEAAPAPSTAGDVAPAAPLTIGPLPPPADLGARIMEQRPGESFEREGTSPTTVRGTEGALPVEAGRSGAPHEREREREVIVGGRGTTAEDDGSEGAQPDDLSLRRGEVTRESAPPRKRPDAPERGAAAPSGASVEPLYREWLDWEAAQEADRAGALYRVWRTPRRRNVGRTPPLRVPRPVWAALREAADGGHAEARLELARLLGGIRPRIRSPRSDFPLAAHLLLGLLESGRVSEGASGALEEMRSGTWFQQRAVERARRVRAAPGPR